MADTLKVKFIDRSSTGSETNGITKEATYSHADIELSEEYYTIDLPTSRQLSSGTTEECTPGSIFYVVKDGDNTEIDSIETIGTCSQDGTYNRYYSEGYIADKKPQTVDAGKSAGITVITGATSVDAISHSYQYSDGYNGGSNYNYRRKTPKSTTTINIDFSEYSPIRGGYKLIKGKGSDGNDYTLTGKFTIPSNLGETAPKGYTFTAYYERTAKEVKLNKDGGINGTDGPIYFGENKGYSDYDCSNEIISISKPFRDGYTFKGYYDGSTEIIDEDGNITGTVSSNVTLTAKGEANTYTVSFNKDGNIDQDDYPESIPEGSVDSITVTYDSAYGTLPTPSRKGFTFVNGYTATSGGTKIESDDPVSIAGDHTLYARGTINKYTVTADVSEGNIGITGLIVGSESEDIPCSGSYNYGSSVDIKANISSNSPGDGKEWKFGNGQDENYTLISTSNPYTLEHVPAEDYKIIGCASGGYKTYNVNITSGTGVNIIELLHLNSTGDEYISDGELSSISEDFLYNSKLKVIVKEFKSESNAGTDGTTPGTGEDKNYRYEGLGGYNGSTEVSKYNPYDFLLKSNTTLTATCEAHRKYEVTLGSTTDGSIAFTEIDSRGDSSSVRYLLPAKDSVGGDTTVSIEATPNPGKQVESGQISYDEGSTGTTIEDETGTTITDTTLTYAVPTRNCYIRATFEDGEYYGEDKDKYCHWNPYYIFVKTNDPVTPWRVVKQIKHRVREGNIEYGWPDDGYRSMGVKYIKVEPTADGDNHIFTIPDEIDLNNVEILNYLPDDYEYSGEEGSHVVTVSDERVCKIGYLSDHSKLLLVLKGDTNLDKKVTNADSTFVFGIFNGRVDDYTDDNLFAGDVNDDGVIDYNSKEDDQDHNENLDYGIIKAVVNELKKFTW